jgi:hypothetical protein
LISTGNVIERAGDVAQDFTALTGIEFKVPKVRRLLREKL